MIQCVTAKTRAASRTVLSATPRITDAGNARGQLRGLLIAQLSAVMTPEVLALRRLVIGEMTRSPELARALYEHGPRAAIASLAIFQFLWTWNDLLVALTLARDTQPVTVAIFSQLRAFSANIELIAPATFVSLVIPLAVFFAFQRYFVEGLLAGSVK